MLENKGETSNKELLLETRVEELEEFKSSATFLLQLCKNRLEEFSDYRSINIVNKIKDLLK